MERLVIKFTTPLGDIGVEPRFGLVAVDNVKPSVEGYVPWGSAISNMQDPTAFTKLYERAKAGDTSVIGEGDGMNDAGFEITATGVHAELNIGMDTYEESLTFAQFDPILTAWQKAWSAALEYRKLHKV